MRLVCSGVIMIRKVGALREDDAFVIRIVCTIDAEDDAFVDDSLDGEWTVQETRQPIVYACHLERQQFSDSLYAGNRSGVVRSSVW